MVIAQRIGKSALKLLVSFVIITTVSGCSFNQASRANNWDKETSDEVAKVAPVNTNSFFLQKSQDDFAQMLGRSEIKSRLLDQYDDWKGVRYRWGGTNKKGVDCSGFVQITFREQFGVELPRTTLQQKNSGTPIKMSQLQVGDLVLFDITSRTRHIGIYLGNKKFVHAATSSGVMISALDDSYWSKRYREARRVLDNETAGIKVANNS